MDTLPPLGDPVQPAKQLRRWWVIMGLLIVCCGAAFVINQQFLPEKDDHTDLVAGECFQNTGSADKPRVKKRDCGDAQAEYKVLKRVDDGLTSLACMGVEGATGAVTQTGGGSLVLCYQEIQR
ncbi:hypothetical protein [Streptomyces sp. ISL-11]|uniref:LppU/SCO3897 family protein n=1 Tax=Streptomyces sp. ISL-11 TaxID=2819174 RepID=UPI001BEBE02A|nr:hypothetical protein [Streptomyces sp. ISL-11]MBT2383501.1 hypothetical protein [Streptomyces sp. ISL-11]